MIILVKNEYFTFKKVQCLDQIQIFSTIETIIKKILLILL